MKTQDIIIEVAKLDGRCVDLVDETGVYECIAKRGSPDDSYEKFDYLTSRDAIVPVIEKQEHLIIAEFIKQLNIILVRDLDCEDSGDVDIYDLITATPQQLCEALLRATGKWKE